MNKRNEELRRARVAAAEQANTNFYKQYVRRRRDEQRRLMAGARDIIFKNKDAPKMLLRFNVLYIHCRVSCREL